MSEPQAGCVYRVPDLGIDSIDPAFRAGIVAVGANRDWSSTHGDSPWSWDYGKHIAATPVSQPVPIPPVDPPVEPVFPTSGVARTAADLNLRDEPSTAGQVLLTIPRNGRVYLTGQLHGPWRSVRYAPPSRTVTVRGVRIVGGWVHAGYLTAPRSAASDVIAAADFPPFTHERTWCLVGADGKDAAEVAELLDGIWTDVRGWQRAGVRMRRVKTAGEAHVLVELHPSPCGGAPGCFWQRSGEPAHIQFQTKLVGSSSFLRPVNHEAGHDLGHFFDHYKGAPKHPRAIRSVMGDWYVGDEFQGWPDVDDIRALEAVKAGKPLFVYAEQGG